MSIYKASSAFIAGAVFSTAAWAADPVFTDVDPLPATDLPAVSEINGKIETGYAHYGFDNAFLFGADDADGFFTQGAVSIPLGHRWGAQIDGGYQSTDINFGPISIDVDSYGIGGHLFWRDPTVGLLGIYGGYVKHEVNLFFVDLDVDVTTLAVEGEAYLNDWTVRGQVGVEHLDVDFFGDTTEFFAKGNLDYYFTDNIMGTIGARHSFEQTTFTAGLEAQFEVGGMTPVAFVNGTFNGDVHSVMAGMRFHLASQPKSLKGRHREDDPSIDLFGNFGAGGSCVIGAASNLGMFGFDDRLDVRSTNAPWRPAPQADDCGLGGNNRRLAVSASAL